MSRPEYDNKREHEVIGEYSTIENGDGPYVLAMTPEPELYRPITPRENFKMFFAGDEKPYWIPEIGWMVCDLRQFRPRQHPDNLANHQLFDGGPKVDFDVIGDEVYGWLQILYRWDPASAGCTAKPGVITVPDISEWEKYISIPNLDEMDWDEIVAYNADYLNTSKANQLGIQFGFWERLMNLMGVSDAAVALIDEDLQPGVHRLFSQLADLYIDYIGRMSDRFQIDSVFFHDDWGTQNQPFFSIDTCREMVSPYMKKVIDFCHSRGIIFEHHCCGNAEDLVPVMVEEGDDFWFPQAAINDVDMLLDTYPEMAFGVLSSFLDPDDTESQVRQKAHEWFEKYGNKNALLVRNRYTPGTDVSKYPFFKDEIYKIARQEYR